MLIALALALAAAPQTTAADVAEVQCIYNDVAAQSNAAPDAQPDVEASLARCKAKYGWTADQGEMALAIAVQMSSYADAAREAVDAGLDPDFLDQVYREMTPEQRAELSSGKTASKETLGQLLAKLRKQTENPTALTKGVGALNWHAILDAAGEDFLKRRKTPG